MKQVDIREIGTGKHFFEGEAACVYNWGVPIEWVDWDADELTITVSAGAKVEVTQHPNGDLGIELGCPEDDDD